VTEALARLQQELETIERRVAARYPTSAPGIELPDYTPLLEARDLAQSRISAIGSVNPRPSGLIHGLIQFAKRLIARSLNFLFRPQVEFNYASVAATQATLESLHSVNRALSDLAFRIHQHHREELADLDARLAHLATRVDRGLADLEVRQGRLFDAQRLQYEALAQSIRAQLTGEMIHLRAHLEASRDQQRDALAPLDSLRRELASRDDREDQLLAQQRSDFEGLIRDQHQAFRAELDAASTHWADTISSVSRAFEQKFAHAGEALQARFWEQLAAARREYEQVIHAELRVVRQRLAAPPSDVPTASSPAIPQLDYARFADKFRGSEDYVRSQLRRYLPYFEGRRRILDIGCGRGEFLELLRDAGLDAQGIDNDPESVALCRSKGLAVDQADLFAFLDQAAEGSYDAIFCSQVIEHLPVAQLPALVRTLASRLATNGLLLLETPNPESLTIFATHFYLDPTHQRPIPPQLLAFLFEEAGLGRIEILRHTPAADSMPALLDLPESFRNSFFGPLDYACLGIKL
jgi:O-antigen chain-terminating methyltransferase